MQASRSPLAPWLGIGLVGIVAAFARIHGIGEESMWLDETLTAYYTTGLDKVRDLSYGSIHPPLYFAAMTLWRDALGSDEASLRLYSALFSLANLAVVALLARDLGGRRAGVVALLILAVHPLDLYYAQEARSYTQLAFLGSLAALCLWRWMSASAAGRPRPRWILGYAVAAVLASYTHYLAALLLLAQGLFALGWFAAARRWRDAGAYGLCAVTVAVAFLPWLRLVLAERGGVVYDEAGLAWLPPPAPWELGQLLWGELVSGRICSSRTLVFPDEIFDLFRAYGIVTVIAVLAWTGRLAWRAARAGLSLRDRPPALGYAAWLAVGPALLGILVSYTVQPVVARPRFAHVLLSAVCLVVACALARIRDRAALGLAVGALLVVLGTGAVVQQHAFPKKEPWRAVGVAVRGHENVVIVPEWDGYPVSVYAPGFELVDWAEVARRRRQGFTVSLWVCSVDFQVGFLPDQAARLAELRGMGELLESTSLAPGITLDRILLRPTGNEG